MNIVYAGEALPETLIKSIMLCGPTPRSKDVESWRKDAIQILEDIGYDGTVFVSEPRNGNWKKDYEDQVEWEENVLNLSDCILFWVPRDLETLPAFTTNVEYGVWSSSGKVVFGAPSDSPKNEYLKYYAEKYNISCSETLTDTISSALELIGEGSKRIGGERYIPNLIWKLDSFQSWYKSQVQAGNRLDSARLLYSFRPGFKDFVFLWILKADIYIISEKRHKINEFVLARPDISSILLWYKGDSLEENKIVIIKEFRTPARTEDGFVRELVGGSAKETKSPEEIAAEEVLEETGFLLDSNKLKYNKSRQLNATLSSHKSYLYSYKLDEKELEWFQSQKDIPHGVEKDSERTYIEIYSLQELLESEAVDWSTLGMIFQVASNDD